MGGAAPDGGKIVAEMRVSLRTREPRPGYCKFWIFDDGLLKKLNRGLQTCVVVLAGEDQASEKDIVGARICRIRRCDLRFFSRNHFCGQGRGNGSRHFALDRKDVVHLAVVILRPQMIVARRTDQLDVDAYRVAGSLHAAFKDIGYAEPSGDFRNIPGPARKLIG